MISLSDSNKRFQYKKFTHLKDNFLFLSQKNRMLLLCIALAIIGVLQLVFVAVVSWKLTSIDKVLTEERVIRKVEIRQIFL